MISLKNLKPIIPNPVLEKMKLIKRAAADFAATDRNKDGKLSGFELAAGADGKLCVYGPREMKRFEQFDRNNDGAVTRDEYIPARIREYTRK